MLSVYTFCIHQGYLGSVRPHAVLEIWTLRTVMLWLILWSLLYIRFYLKGYLGSQHRDMTHLTVHSFSSVMSHFSELTSANPYTVLDKIV